MDEFRARAWEKRRKKKTTNNHHHHHHHRDKKRRRKTALYTLVNQTTKRNAREKILWIWELKHERKNCHHHWEREECFCSWLSNNSKKKDIFIILWCANDIREIEYKEEEKKKPKKKEGQLIFLGGVFVHCYEERDPFGTVCWQSITKEGIKKKRTSAHTNSRSSDNCSQITTRPATIQCRPKRSCTARWTTTTYWPK